MQPRELDNSLSMAAFLAFIEIRSFLTGHPSLTATAAIESLTRLRERASGLDFRGGLALHQQLGPSLNWTPSENCLRTFIFEWVRVADPGWLQLAPYGRERLRRALDSNQVQCFREAGLFDESPDRETIEWWDLVAARMRGISDAERMKRARRAEWLSLQHERRRVEDLGIPDEPKWVSLEDNSLGYDILSFDRDREGRTVNRLVEVKSRLSDSIFLTRNEWENASGAPQRTVIQVWDMPDERLHEYRPAQIAPDIPLDQGSGIWQNVRIPLHSPP